MAERVRLPYRPHPGQLAFHRSRARFRVLCCGRRWGKTNAAIWECFREALAHPRKVVWYIGSTYKQLKPVWRQMLAKFPREYIAKIREVEKEIHLDNEAIIELKSADEPDDLRSVGEDLILAVFDEFAYVSPYVWTIMRPALMDNKAKAVFISTPKGRNHFYEFWLRGQRTIDGQPNPLYHPDWESWQFSTFDNPHIDKEEIEQLIRESGMSALDVAREIYAQFVEATGYVFPLNTIEACIKGELEEPSENESYVMGLDLARVKNYSVAIVLNSQAHVVAYKQMQGPWTAQAKAVAALWQRYHKPPVYFDSTGLGDVFRPLLVMEGVTPLKDIDFRKLKGQIIENLKVGLEDKMLSFPNIPQLIRELQFFEARETSTGRIEYGAPAGAHDDFVCALALAYWGFTRTKAAPSVKRVSVISNKPFGVKPVVSAIPVLRGG